MKDKRFNKIEVRDSISIIESDDGIKRLHGKIPYNTRSFDLGGFFEVITPSAFTKTLADSADVKLLVSHDTSKVLARVKNGSLTLRSVEDGLEFDAILNNTSFANDAYEVIKSNTVNSLSFGFNVVNDEWISEDGKQLRFLKEVKLIEISVAVAFPAYPETETEARNIQLEKIESVLSKDELKEDDYLIIENTIDNLRSLLPQKEERKEQVEITIADEKSLLADETRSFLEQLLAEIKM